MRRERTGVEASGEGAVAVGGNAAGPILTNSSVHITLTGNSEERVPMARPRILPPEVSDFTGRESEIEAIERHAFESLENRRSTSVVVSGKPGVGKTCLAVYIAHRVGRNYADGELYADLRGVDERPASSEEVMARFMQVLGVPEEEIPGDPHARLDAYRRTLTDRSLLIILDNVADEKQIRPLLPPGAGSLVVMTCRNKLLGLESVRRFDLDIFPTATSVNFIRKVVGHEVVDMEPDEAKSVVQFCGHLPLALRIAANRLHATSNMRVSDLSLELRDERDRLEALEVGDLAVRAAFNLSYRKLGKGCRNAFKRLSHVPGGDFGAGICSALTGSDKRQAAKALRKLAEANLIEYSEMAGRFRFHDLVKVFSREQMEKDSVDQIQGVRRRMLAWLRNSALKAQSNLNGVFQVEVPDNNSAEIDSIESAATWVEHEFANAVAALSISESHESPNNTVAFAMALSGICETAGHWSEWETVNSVGLRSAQQIDQRGIEIVFLTARTNLARYRREFSEALVCAEEVYTIASDFGNAVLVAGATNLLGCIKMDLGLSDEAIPLLRESLSLYERLDFKHEVGKVLYNLGTIHRAAGEMSEAIEYFERDLAVCLHTADESGAAETLNTLALAHVELGRFGKAEELQRTALEKFSKIGNPHKISMVTNDLAITLRSRGRHEEALALHLQDIEICRAAMSVSGEALARSNAAEVLNRLGRNDEAAEYSLAAQAMFTQLGDEQRLAKAVVSHIPILFHEGKSDEVEKATTAAIEVLTRFGDMKDVAATHQLLAREYGFLEEWEKVLEHSKESLEIGGDLLTPYGCAVSCGMALRAGSKLGREGEFARFENVLRKAFDFDAGIREDFVKSFGGDVQLPGM
ncbi:tetratricopeptide repeat protein [Streptomyces diacarni]|uniref:ATP-binding protein n=1 Tax=Streptomyces diacarni TaxID=2800381 RepID=UPI0033E40DF1